MIKVKSRNKESWLEDLPVKTAIKIFAMVRTLNSAQKKLSIYDSHKSDRKKLGSRVKQKRRQKKRICVVSNFIATTFFSSSDFKSKGSFKKDSPDQTSVFGFTERNPALLLHCLKHNRKIQQRIFSCSGHSWLFLEAYFVSIMSLKLGVTPKRKIQVNTQNTLDGKEDKE